MRLSKLFASALLLGTATVLISCAESTAPQQASEARAAALTAPELLDGLTSTVDRTVGNTGLLSCRPMPEVRVSKVIGKKGGEIEIGPHTLVIPKNALKSDVRITAYAPSGTVNRIQFSPHGLEFKKSAELTMSYANCNVLGSLLPKHIAYVNQQLSILYLLETVDNFRRREVSADVDHFSEYAIAW